MNDFQKATKKVGQVLARNSPTILTGLSVTGLLTTVGMAIDATPKAMFNLDEERLSRAEKKGKSFFGEKLTKKEIVLLTWKCYIPTAIMGGLTIGCIIGANSINLRRNAALASVYSITETALKEYQSKVIETFGESKARAIKDSIAKDKVENNPVGKNEVIITGKGDTLCYDVLSGRYFTSDIEKIRKIENEINRDLLTENFMSLNDVYYALGLSETKLGGELGWDINDGLIEFNYSSQLTEEGVPCLVIDYGIEPKYNYRDY